MGLRTLDEAEVTGKRVLVRVDFNVPLVDGQVRDEARLKAPLRTIQELRQSGARVILVSHFGRPKGRRVPAMSLEPVVGPLSQLVGAPVAFADDCVGPAALAAVGRLADGGVLLLENLRFHPGEEENDAGFARELAALGDIYVDDAFSASHRAHASTEAIGHILPAYAGRAMQAELDGLQATLGAPAPPVMGTVGGAKVSTKLALLEALVGRLQTLAIGGAMANTFLFALGHEVGASLCETDMASAARRIVAAAHSSGCQILLPTDVVVAEDPRPGASSRVIPLGEIRPDEHIFDIGPNSVAEILQALTGSRTLIWNGPLGMFEVQPFDQGTLAVARHAAGLVRSGRLTAVAGGGETVAALNQASVVGDFSFVSTAGGAFLEWVEGRTLPGVAILQDRRG